MLQAAELLRQWLSDEDVVRILTGHLHRLLGDLTRGFALARLLAA